MTLFLIFSIVLMLGVVKLLAFIGGIREHHVHRLTPNGQRGDGGRVNDMTLIAIYLASTLAGLFAGLVAKFHSDLPTLSCVMGGVAITALVSAALRVWLS
jgi:hypothetical protein